ncbi:hypothetical protein V6N11_016821 [Hibiscus sabdariffa]|uniref:Uncharacterized protein n=1 Tax=Hibiscus sabdariffa TaxID=183260 RepID=A0ABR2TWD5_9ROSI
MPEPTGGSVEEQTDLLPIDDGVSAQTAAASSQFYSVPLMVPNSANDISRIVDGSGIEGAAGVQSPAAGLNGSVSEDGESREADVEGILGRSAGVAVDAVVDDGAGGSSGTPEIDDAETGNPPAVFEHDSSSSSTSARSAGANQGEDAVHADSQLDSPDLDESAGIIRKHGVCCKHGEHGALLPECHVLRHSHLCKHTYKLHGLNLLALPCWWLHFRHFPNQIYHLSDFRILRSACESLIPKGLALMTIQASSKEFQPTFCGGKSSCIHGGKALMLYASLGLLALGSGGLKGALPALGGEQFDHKDPKEAKALARFFNWLLLSTTLGAAVGVTGIVYLSTEKHKWYWGFFISTVATFIGFIILALGKPFYHLRQPTIANSPFMRIAQVIALAIENRRLALPDKPDELYEIGEAEKGCMEERISHTNQFRFLDKATIVPKDSDVTLSPWTVCTVTQVEEVKILTRMLPILCSTIIMNTCLAQLQTFSIQQGNIMDRKLGKLEVPAASIPIIPLVFMSILIPIYELFFVPFARKITHHPSGITQLQRVGVGLVLSAISMAIAGIVEVKRRDQAHKGMAISLFWLSFQFGIFGIADMFTLVGLMEFFYKEAPIGMRSLSTSFTWLSLSFGYFLSTVFVNIINSITERISSSGQGWIHGLDLNQSNLNLFYWFLAILSCLNFVNYLYWASWYKYKTEEPDHTEAKAEAKQLSTGPLAAEEENTLDGGVTQTHEAPFSVQTEDSKQQLIQEPDHSEAKAKDLSTGPLLAEEENTLDGGVTQTHEAPSSVQTEDSKQQLRQEPDHPEAKAKDLSTGQPLTDEENTLDGGVTQTHEAPSSVQTEESKQQLIKELDHPEAKGKDLSTEPILAEEENTLDGEVTQTHEAPSSVQTEESKQQLTSC